MQIRVATPQRLGRWGTVAILGLAAVAAHGCSADEGDEAAVETVAVDRGAVVAKITATGTLSALVTVQVGSQVSGRIAELLVDFNSTVAKGQVLARLDPLLFEAALAQTRANYEAAQANVTKAKAQARDAARQAERAASLAARELIAAADSDSAQAGADVAAAQVQAAEASVRQTKAALDQAVVNLGYTTIVSPIDGVVISRNVDVGQTVAASLQAPTLFVLAEDLRKMQVNTSVAEADIGALRADMRAEFSVDAYPSKRFHGTVRQIRNAAQTVQNVVTYDAVIDVANDALELKPGMTANVTFVVDEKRDVLRVPNAALRYRPSESGENGAVPAVKSPSRHEGGPRQRAVWVADEKGPRRVPIETGITDGSFTEVVSGELRVGDRVITRGDAMPGRGRGAPASHGPRFL